MNNAPHRVVFRVEVEKQTVDEFEKISEESGITRIALASKLLNWFSSQPTHVQAHVLGMYGEQASQQVVREILGSISNHRKNKST